MKKKYKRNTKCCEVSEGRNSMKKTGKEDKKNRMPKKTGKLKRNKSLDKQAKTISYIKIFFLFILIIVLVVLIGKWVKTEDIFHYRDMVSSIFDLKNFIKWVISKVKEQFDEDMSRIYRNNSFQSPKVKKSQNKVRKVDKKRTT